MSQEVVPLNDSTMVEAPMFPPDSILERMKTSNPLLNSDSLLRQPKKTANFLDGPIKYSARDSMPISMENGEQIIYLYGDASVEYGTIKLNAEFVSVNFAKKEIYASGVADSLGTIVGKPKFSEGQEEFDCGTLRYNFLTKKGFIEDVVTKQQDGLVRSAKAKMLNKDVYCMVDGKYSPCDAEHPHYYLQMTKGKVLKDKAIITGRAYLVLLDFPIYFPFLPYGYIPTNKKTYTSGVIIPSYGEEERWGFYLKDGGFYWAASDYFDMKVTGDIYSKGSWGVNFDTRYKLRYKFSGNVGFNIKYNTTGEKDINQNPSQSFKVRWSHNQDAKSNPSSNFSANIDFSTSGYSKLNEYEDPNKFLENSKSSGISYRKTFLNTPFSFSANAKITQNTKDSSLYVSLPSMTVNMKTIEPFKPKKRVGKKKVWEDIKIGYSANIQNSIKTKESELLKTPIAAWKKGIDHNIPITLMQFKLLKHINVTPSISYKERWFFDYIEKNWVDGYEVVDKETGLEKWVPGHVEKLRHDGFKRNYEYSGGIGSSTTLYGFYQLKNPNSKLKPVVRHKADLSASFSYHPDFGEKRYGFYDWVQVDSLGKMQQYSYFEGGVMSYTSTGRSGSVSFGMNNNIELKMVDLKDTSATEKFKKIPIFDNLGFSGSYNLAADSMNLSPISINARTKIAGYSINISGTLNPYALNEKGRVYNEYQWNHATGIGKLGRLTNLSTGFNLNYSSDKLKKKLDELKKEKKGEEGKKEEEVAGKYAVFDMPWNINFNYSFNYQNSNNQPRVIQTVGFSGGIDFSDKWKSTFTSGFDMDALKLTHTSVSITRDLHCWSMSFNFSPIGTSKFYTFTLSANAAMLKDVKIDKTSRPGGSYGY
jgi:hypothetical protein